MADAEVSCLEAKPLIIDVGSSFVRVGLPHTAPQLSIPTLVGYPKTQGYVGMEGRSVFVGLEAVNRRAVCYPSSPVTQSQVTNWTDLEVIFRHAYSLLGIQPESQPVIVTESLGAKHNDRLELGKMLFDMRVPAVWVVPQGVTGLFATGRTSGVVLDSGEGRSHTIAVLNGVALPASKVSSRICGGLITENLTRLLAIRGSMTKDLFAQVKEHLCYCAMNLESESRDCDANPGAFQREHELPDGHYVSVGRERFEASEINFTIPRQTDFQGKEMVDLPSSLVLSATAVEESLRETMLRNICVVGGNTLLEGFHERMQLELNRRAALKEFWNRRALVVPKVPNHLSTSECNWIGAAIMGRLSSSRKMFVTEEMIKEEGMNAIAKHRLAEFSK